MKKHISVLSLVCRSSLLANLLSAIFAVALEFVLFFTEMNSNRNISIELVFEGSGIHWVLLAWFLLVTFSLCRTGCAFGSKPVYTLSRLRISEKMFFAWQSIYNIAVFALMLMVQILAGYLMCTLYISQASPEYITNQTVFLAFYRSDFLHSIFPLEDAARWAANIAAVLAAGITSAYYPFLQRRGKFAFSAVVVTVSVVFGFVRQFGDFGVMPFACVIAAACAVFNVFALQTDDEEDEYEEYENGART